MDQLKTFFRQCIKYRFWITVGVSVLLPMIGYFVGSGAYSAATTKREGEIKAADTAVAKYTAPNPPIPAVTQLVAEKKEVLTKDVDATQRKLYQLQEPLLKWPEVVESKFRTWGRKWPENVDRGQVQAAIYDYTNAYPDFVSQVYQTFKPWNPEDGKGIVYAPEQSSLLKPAAFTLEAPPELGKVWAEQERLWVITAILDAIAKVNDQAGAKDWESAWIKEIVDLDVGSASAQDQLSMAKAVVLEAAPPLYPDGTPPPDPAAAEGGAGGPSGMSSGGMGAGAKTDEVYFLQAQPSQPFKVMPIQLTVRVDQNRLSEFLVGLENSPMAIQVMEPEISKPTTPVIKPVYGETTGFAAGSMMGGRGGMGMGYSSGMENSSSGMSGRMQGMRGGGFSSGRSGSGGMSESSSGMSSGMYGGMSGGAATKKSGTDLRAVNKAAERKKKEKDAAEKKKNAAPKKNVDQYYNVIQVTVYGQARFYNTPPPIPPVEPSTSTEPAPSPAGPTAAPTPAVGQPAQAVTTTPAPTAGQTPTPASEPATPPTGTEPAPKVEVPKADPAAPKT